MSTTDDFDAPIKEAQDAVRGQAVALLDDHAYQIRALTTLFGFMGMHADCVPKLCVIQEYLYDENPEKFATLTKTLETLIDNVVEQIREAERLVHPG